MPSEVRKVIIDDVRPGMILANDLVSSRGIVMLSEGTVLAEHTIERIKCWGFSHLDIVDDTNEVSCRCTAKLDFIDKYTSLVDKVNEAFQGARYCKRIPLDQLEYLADQVTGSLVSARGVINSLHILRLVDDYTFQHSVNVATLSGLFGRWLGISEPELKKLVFAGLLHDIGKTQIPLAILNKPGRLTDSEMDIMKGHALQGFEILKKSGLDSNIILEGVFAHHERLDGSGYPRALKGSHISQAAKIIAIADIYDAMTSDRVYRRSVTPFAVIETLCNEMFNKLDPTMCTVILNYLQDFFIGNIVLLNDGRQAEVIYVDKTRESRPVVKTTEGDYLDLEQNREVTIVEIIN